MEMNLFIGATIDIPNSKASKIIKEFCNLFSESELVINSNLFQDHYKTSYEKISDSKYIKHVIHFNCNDEKQFYLSFELLRGKNEFQLMTGGTVATNDEVVKVINALSAELLTDLGIVVDNYEEVLSNFEMCQSLYNKEDIDDKELERIFTKILKPIMSFIKIYGTFNAVNVGRFNIVINENIVKFFLNDDNMVEISPMDIVVSNAIYENPKYMDYLDKMANEISTYANALTKTLKNPVSVKLTDYQDSKLNSILQSIVTPELLESVKIRPGQDPVFVDEDDKNYIYVQGPTNRESTVVLGIKSKITGKIFVLNLNIRGVYCFLFEEIIDKDGNIDLKTVSELDDELFKDLEDYAEVCKIRNSNLIYGTSDVKKTILS